MKDKKIKEIREAVCANRGGLGEATDGQIMIIWRSLPPDVQKQYLDSIKEGKGQNAVSDPSKREL